MTNQDVVLGAMRSQGRADALDLRRRAPEMDGTALIAEEEKIPVWDGTRDYTEWAIGSPVADEGQVWTLIQPHNAAYYPERPSGLRALWGLCHTKDADKAKPWVDPYGTSGMYMAGECYRDGNTVYRALQDDLVYNAEALPSAWEVALTL